MPRADRDSVRRYDVDLDAALPPLDALTGDLDGVQSLESDSLESSSETTSFDTTEEDLRRAGLTLIREASGDGGRWHLGVPLADGATGELSAALGRSVRTPPLALRRAAWVHTRGEALAPTIQIAVRRVETPLVRDGLVIGHYVEETTSQRDLALDDVVAWRGVMVQLDEPDHELVAALGRRLKAAGARPVDASVRATLAPSGSSRPRNAMPAKRLTAKSSAGDVVLRALDHEARRIIDTDLLVRLGRPDSVHRMRVAVRRCRSILETFGSLFADDATTELLGGLRRLGSELGTARDLEVLRERFARMEGGAQIHETKARLELDRALAREHRAAIRVGTAALDSEDYRAVVVGLEALIARPALTARAGKPAARQLPRAISRAFDVSRDQMTSALSLPAGPERDGLLHDARRSIKRVRYATEAALPVFGRPAARFADALAHLQDGLGAHHDCVVALARLEESALTATPSVAFGLGRIHAFEAQLLADLDSRISGQWSAAARKSLRSWLA